MKFFSVLAAFVALAAAAPTLEDRPIEAREPVIDPALAERGWNDCNGIPNEPDWTAVGIAYRECKAQGCPAKMQLALMMTGWVESHWNVIDCGDADSKGLYQQRDNGHWGSYHDRMNPLISTRNFLRDLWICYNNHKGWNSGDLAQCAQRSEKPDAYNQNAERARAILNEAQDRWGSYNGGGDGSVNVGDNPNHGGGNNNGGGNNGGGNGKCDAYVTVKKGDTCASVAKKGGNIGVSALKKLNPGQINGSCTNLVVGKKYCTHKKSGGGGGNNGGNNGGGKCTWKVTVRPGETCASAAKRGSKGAVSAQQFIKHNPGRLNKNCTNLQAHATYCLN